MVVDLLIDEGVCYGATVLTKDEKLENILRKKGDYSKRRSRLLVQIQHKRHLNISGLARRNSRKRRSFAGYGDDAVFTSPSTTTRVMLEKCF